MITYYQTLYNDASTHKKLEVMNKVDAMDDDFRNYRPEVADQLEEFLQIGKTYEITVREVKCH